MASEPLNAQLVSSQLSSAAPDGGNKWASYFGPSSSQIQTNAYDKYAYETYDLPEAYKGRNLYLRDTIDGFILEDNEWYTRVALPFAQTNDIHLAWFVLHSSFSHTSCFTLLFCSYFLFLPFYHPLVKDVRLTV